MYFFFFCISFFARTRTGSCYFNMAEKIPGGPRRPSALLKKFKKAADTVKQTQRFTTLKRKSRLSNKFKESVLVQLSVKCIAWHIICRVLTTNSWEKEDLRAGYMKHPVRGMSPSVIIRSYSRITPSVRRPVAGSTHSKKCFEFVDPMNECEQKRRWTGCNVLWVSEDATTLKEKMTWWILSAARPTC